MNGNAWIIVLIVVYLGAEVLKLVGKAYTRGNDISGLERKVDRIPVHLGLLTRRWPDTCPTEVSPEVWKPLVTGRKIQAIKKYRERTGAGLKESKDAIEALEAKYGPV